ncbi:helix-turn-helix transcriptional regulator [Glycomyces sp. NRRL B-16210]|uniref:helix-turn-helix domain-containing protein n=1 Tax=Glycomyces sp. NRRL B-16210 TaxID=1463821 RepID=UPI00068F2223|nr:helix-turn-helix transcriptional regulator [Glycomyces sp. NRRL B-16210]
MAVGTDGSTPDESRRRLADELKRVRQLSGLSGRDLADKIHISQSKISRIESGAAFPSLPEVRAWAEAVEASDDTRRMLDAMAEAAHTTILRWQSALKDRPHLQHSVEKDERSARRVLTFQPSVIPGLLQTAEYARRVFEMFQEPSYTPDRLAAAVTARLERQSLLHDPRRRFNFLITEAALRWRPSTTAMLAAQIDRISSLSTLGNVTVGVLPFSRQAAVPYSHGFTVYEPAEAEDDVLVNAETIHANLQLVREADVAVYQRRWSALDRSALHGDEARSVLQGLVVELRATDG